MTTFRSRIVTLSILGIVFSALLAHQAAAEAPDAVYRVFAVFYGVEGDQGRDYEAEGSLAVISNAVQPVSTQRFQVDEDNGDLSGMAMVGGAAIHIGIGGAESNTYRWIYDPLTSSPQEALPPTGARATTGPDGDVEVLGRYFVKEFTDGCGSNCGWLVLDSAFGADNVMCLAAGWFSK